MNYAIETVPAGMVTSPEGFKAGAVCAGIKASGLDKPDLAILYSEVPCTATAVFTTNLIKAAPVVLCQQRLRGGRARAVVVNSGCANACVGDQGLRDAAGMAESAARKVDVSDEDVLVASTGIIGRLLPMEKIRIGMTRIVLSRDGGHEFTRAIMTTDTAAKEVAVQAEGFMIGGTVKGSGMIHPNLATLLVFLTTDAAVDSDFLRLALSRAVEISFNMVSIDGDTSTNDMVLLMANGLAGNRSISENGQQAEVFQQALDRVCIHLAKKVARDGEGATRLIEVIVNGAASLADARLAARTIVSSPLVKTAVHGCDPNWGRVMAVVGRSGVKVEEARIDLAIGGINVAKAGCPLPFKEAEVAKALGEDEVIIDLNLNLGGAAATAWGCDLSEEYVKINSRYRS